MPSAIGLPEDLIKLFKPLFCDLCSTKLNSPSSARLHYESKNHEKKINAWLSEWSIKTGEPVPKRQIVNILHSTNWKNGLKKFDLINRLIKDPLDRMHYIVTFVIYL